VSGNSVLLLVEGTVRQGGGARRAGRRGKKGYDEANIVIVGLQ
jgi:hypothetical protein